MITSLVYFPTFKKISVTSCKSDYNSKDLYSSKLVVGKRLSDTPNLPRAFWVPGICENILALAPSTNLHLPMEPLGDYLWNGFALFPPECRV